MALYKALYRKKMQIASLLDRVEQKDYIRTRYCGSDNSKFELVRQKLLMAQSWHKSYADRHRRPLEFLMGDHVFLRVTLVTGIGRSIRAKKLTLRFIGPFEILERIRPIAYRIALPPQLSSMHEVFHMSQLKKYQPDPSHVIESEEIELQKNLTYKAKPERIIDVKEK
ncbi:uncharacterized protein LOC129286482 [Prosopis cineraria]|uniref:uncharacterized protein LOC129286482 n=1 Tax=Prosopis cineraria TaxID=364024 RepID=UPI002410998B|nr:uncharacterized protein LOC129286482 [Prosopis cineraria]